MKKEFKIENESESEKGNDSVHYQQEETIDLDKSAPISLKIQEIDIV